jgi:hypothetical protein
MKPSREQLQLYFYGGLDTTTSESIAALLASDPALREELAAIAREASSIARAIDDVTAPRSSNPRVIPPDPRPLRVRPLVWRAFAVAAGLLLATTLLAPGLWQRPATPHPNQQPQSVPHSNTAVLPPHHRATPRFLARLTAGTSTDGRSTWDLAERVALQASQRLELELGDGSYLELSPRAAVELGPIESGRPRLRLLAGSISLDIAPGVQPLVIDSETGPVTGTATQLDLHLDPTAPTPLAIAVWGGHVLATSPAGAITGHPGEMLFLGGADGPAKRIGGDDANAWRYPVALPGVPGFQARPWWPWRILHTSDGRWAVVCRLFGQGGSGDLLRGRRTAVLVSSNHGDDWTVALDLDGWGPLDARIEGDQLELLVLALDSDVLGRIQIQLNAPARATTVTELAATFQGPVSWAQRLAIGPREWLLVGGPDPRRTQLCESHDRGASWSTPETPAALLAALGDVEDAAPQLLHHDDHLLIALLEQASDQLTLLRCDHRQQWTTQQLAWPASDRPARATRVISDGDRLVFEVNGANGLFAGLLLPGQALVRRALPELQGHGSLLLRGPSWLVLEDRSLSHHRAYRSTDDGLTWQVAVLSEQVDGRVGGSLVGAVGNDGQMVATFHRSVETMQDQSPGAIRHLATHLLLRRHGHATPGQAGPPASAPWLQQRIAMLVEDLAGERYAQREAAEQALAELGSVARQALLEATASDDPELALRARRLLARIGEPWWR